jgi:phosphoglycolate phosphatase-like HAD superfamily hydrolase
MIEATPQTLIWDLDGTLLDSFGIHEDILAQVLPRHGLVVPPREVIMAHFHGRLHESIGSLLGNAVTEQQLAAIIKDFLVIDDAYITHPDSHLFADALGLATRAHAQGAAQIIVTNRAHGVDRGNASPRTLVENSALRPLITQIICGDEGEHRKPLKEALAEVEYDPATTLVIGDQFVDAQFAHNLGASAVLVQRHHEMPHLERLADGWESRVTIVKTLEEIDL